MNCSGFTSSAHVSALRPPGLQVVVLELRQGVFDEHLRVVDMDDGAVLHQHVAPMAPMAKRLDTKAHHKGRRLAHVSGVLLKGEAEHRDLLLGHGVEQGLDMRIDDAPTRNGLIRLPIMLYTLLFRIFGPR